MNPNTEVMRPEIGEWYARTDKGELFQVVGRDDASRSIEIQTIDGDVDEIDADTWRMLPLEHAAPPEDENAPMDVGEPEDLGYSRTDMTASGWGEAPGPVRSAMEIWQDATPEDERDPLGDGAPVEPYAADEDAARAVL